jgi:hypothetical protein
VLLVSFAEVRTAPKRSDAELGIYSPLIVCGANCGWSRHMFARNQRVDGKGGGTSVSVIYACKTCGKERVYGNGANVAEFVQVTA